jgi:putative membrane protein
MPSPVQAALESWSAPVPLTLVMILSAFLYLRGWRQLHSASANVIPAWRAGSFLLGLFLIWVALGSPLAAFDEELLTVHMVQHLLLSTFAPPLLLLGAPALPLFRALPLGVMRRIVGPFLRWWPARKLQRTLAHPVVCWLAAVMTLVIWHIPAVFESALHSDRIHEVEHLSFLVTGLLFWWPVIAPWPSIARWPRWSFPLYLFCATLPCDVLSAFLAFCDRVVYPNYLLAPRIFSLSALADQEFAGSLMWVSVTFAYLVPAVVIATQLLSRPSSHPLSAPELDSPGTRVQPPNGSKAQVA